jgi:predicted HTH domain antitoxin
MTKNKVLEMVRDKEITLSRGAELLKMPLQDFLELVSENHISVLDYEPDKVEQNLLALKKLSTQF